MRLLTVLVLVAGCSAEMVQLPGGTANVANAPVNEQARPGVVRYATDGDKNAEATLRADAYKQMQSACGGPYRILSEDSRNESEGSFTVGQGSSTSESTVSHEGIGKNKRTVVTTETKYRDPQTINVSTDYVYIHFACETAPQLSAK